MRYRILAVNPGSTSTKIALFENEAPLFRENIEHTQAERESYRRIIDQIPMRRRVLRETLAAHGFGPTDLSAVVGRGGLFPPVRAGGYRVNRAMLDLILEEKISPHASNLGAVLADDLAREAGIPAYIYDAVSASDFPPMVKITGWREVERQSFYHVLNSRAAAIRYAERRGRHYRDMNFIVAHLGGGITVGAHLRGKIVDSISDDGGPFAPERSGCLPLLYVIDLCYSGAYTHDDMINRVRGRGGLRDLLGTSDGREIMRRIAGGDAWAAQVMEAQAYQIAKGIAILVPALRGDCDAIILTGGLAHDAWLTDRVAGYVSTLAPVEVMPGEFEMEALAGGALRILRGEEAAEEM